MTWASLFREIWRDSVSGVSRAGLFASLLGACRACLSVMGLIAVHQLTSEADAYRTARAAVVTIYAHQRIDGSSCESLNQVPGVMAAGAIRESDELVPATLPDSSLSAFDVTSSLPALLGGVPATAGISLSASAADQLGVVPGDRVEFTTGQLATIESVYEWDETDGRRAGYGHAALVPVPAADTFDECWAEIWPVSPEIEQLLRLTVVPEPGAEPPTLTQLNTTLGASFDAKARLASGIARWLPIPAALIGFGLGFVAVFSRRLEIAGDLHAGVTHTDLTVKLLAETLAWVAMSLGLIVAPMALACGVFDPVDRLGVAVHVSTIVISGTSSVVLGALVARASVRESGLNNYFHNRT